MDASKQFARYMEYLAEGLGQADRRAGLTGYCTGLTLPLGRQERGADGRPDWPAACERQTPIHASFCGHGWVK